MSKSEFEKEFQQSLLGEDASCEVRTLGGEAVYILIMSDQFLRQKGEAGRVLLDAAVGHGFASDC